MFEQTVIIGDNTVKVNGIIYKREKIEGKNAIINDDNSFCFKVQPTDDSGWPCCKCGLEKKMGTWFYFKSNGNDVGAYFRCKNCNTQNNITVKIEEKQNDWTNKLQTS